ncbi:hypothetical protein RyT2_15340 [Pseudolactococcus yaeyamensis]
MFFVTKMDDGAYLGSILINAKSQGSYFNSAKKALNQEFGENQVQFVTLNDLYEQLGNTDTQEKILLSKYAKAYKKAILSKYPSATIGIYEFEEEKPLQPSPIFWGND